MRKIFVDLDGTLIRTDLFLEGILSLIKESPVNAVRILSWIFKGRAVAKERVAGAVPIDASTLPYEGELLRYLRERKSAGDSLILATASHQSYADEVAAHLGIFDGVLATSGGRNLKAANKLKAILERNGGDDFIYAGDSSADRTIWRSASGSILVNAPSRDVRRETSEQRAELVVQSRPPGWRAFIRGMRIHQYAKNALIFVPLLTSHSYQDVSTLTAAIIAFVCFSLCASGVYFLNDLLDLPSDRLHRTKKDRPLASCDLALHSGVAGAVFLPVLAFGLAALFLPVAFILVMAVYYLTTNLYSFSLKRHSTADVVTLALLYTIRVIAGGAAAGIALSFWLLVFSVFMFLSLAYVKRYVELLALAQGDQSAAPGRGYGPADSETMFSLGVANSTASVLVLAFYLNSPEVQGLYRSPQLLWLLCLLVLFFVNRIWVGARRGKISDDPVVFALKDRVNRYIFLLMAIVTLSARYIAL